MNTRTFILPSRWPGVECICLLVLAVMGCRSTACVQAADTPPARPLTAVAAGTVVGDPTAARWNRSIYLATSRITSGNADSVPAMIRQRVPLFTLTLLATVSKTSTPQQPPVFHLQEVGAGYAVPLDGSLTVIATDNPPAAARIDMIGRQVLAANGRHLSELRCIGMNQTMQVVDVDARFYRAGRPTPVIMRHFIWVEASTGRCSSCVWLLKQQAHGSLEPTADPPRWVAEGTRDDRAIYVDASQFFLGMPTQDAFALLNLPPGTDLAWSPALRQNATRSSYTAPALLQLAAAVQQALAPLQPSAEPSAERQIPPQD